MTPAHIPGSAPKRFSAGRRSLYTDPFAEIQGVSPSEPVPENDPSMKRSSLLPPTLGSFNSFDSPFPLGESPFPVGETNDEAPVQPVVTHESYEYSEQVNGHVETFKTEVDTVQDDHGYHQQIRNEFFVDEAHDATELYAPHQAEPYPDELSQPTVETHGTYQTDDMVIPRQHSTSMIPVISPRQSPPGSELRAIAASGDAGFSSSMDEPEEVIAETVLLPQSLDERDEWFHENQHAEAPGESGVEISILGHPVNENRQFDEFSAVLEGIKSSGDHTSLVAVQNAISNCLDLVRENPINRVLFCEAIEAVSFNDGPLREAARDAVPVLVELLEESGLGEFERNHNKCTTSAALGALWNLTFKTSEDMSIVELISLAKRAMETFPDDASVQCNGSGLLVNLAVDRNGQRNVLNLGCLEALVNAVQNHPDNDTLIEHTCQLLSMIASRKDLKPLLPKSFCKIVSDIAQTRTDPSVLRWGGWLRNLTGV